MVPVLTREVLEHVVSYLAGDSSSFAVAVRAQELWDTLYEGSRTYNRAAWFELFDRFGLF